MVKNAVSEAATDAEQLFTGKPSDFNADPNSLLYLSNQAGIGNTPLTDAQGNCVNATDLIFTEVFLAAVTAPIGPEREAATEDVTYLYQKLGADGEHLKFGITDNPATRYTAAEMNGRRLNIIAQGARDDMLQLERNLHETLPIGPEEGQRFYIQIQVNKGLAPPPYK